MSLFSVPVLIRATHDNKNFFDMYVELDIESDSLEEAIKIAHNPIPDAGGPIEKHVSLMSVVAINPWEPENLPGKEVVME